MRIIPFTRGKRFRKANRDHDPQFDLQFIREVDVECSRKVILALVLRRIIASFVGVRTCYLPGGTPTPIRRVGTFAHPGLHDDFDAQSILLELERELNVIIPSTFHEIVLNFWLPQVDITFAEWVRNMVLFLEENVRWLEEEINTTSKP